MSTVTRKKVGTVGVDSGQLMIIDPCYIDSAWEGDPPPGKKYHSASYLEVCETTNSREGYGPVIRYPNGVTGLGFAFSTTWGDGEYEIYETRNSSGHLVKMEIVLASQEEVKYHEDGPSEDYDDELEDYDDEPVAYGDDDFDDDEHEDDPESY